MLGVNFQQRQQPWKWCTISTLTTDMNVQEFKADPINWASKRGLKVVYGNVEDLQMHPDNARFVTGQSYFGVEVEKDTLDLDSIVERIKDAGMIHTPILVSKQADGKLYTLQGNRRAGGGKRIIADPKSPTGLVEMLRTKTPMLILEGLSHDQELKLIHDQEQKKFLKSEEVKHLFEEFRKNRKWLDIANERTESLAQLTNNTGKLADWREIADPETRRKFVESWFRGTLNDKLFAGFKLGTFVQKCILLSYMREDNVKIKGDEKPYFKFTGPKQVARLAKAKEADGAKWNGTMPVEGSEFAKVLLELRKESYPELYGITAEPKPQTDKVKSFKDTKAQYDLRQSRAMKAILEWVMCKEADDLQIRDEFAAIQEAKQMLVEQRLSRLEPHTRAIVEMCLVETDVLKFSEWLDTNSVGTDLPPGSPGDNTGVDVEGVSNAG